MAYTRNFGTDEAPLHVEFSEDHKEYFADGAAGLAIGYPMSKVVLTSIDPHNPNLDIETRKAVCTLSITTETLIEIAKMVIGNAAKSKDFLQDQSTEATKRLAEMLSNIEVDDNEKNQNPS